MKVNCEFLILCERVLQDRGTGLLTIVQGLEQISATGFPSLHAPFAFSARYRWEGPGDAPEEELAFEVRLRRLDADRDPETVWKVNGVWNAGIRRLRAFQNFPQLRLNGPGHLRFRIEHRFGGGRWKHGPLAGLDVVQSEMTAAQSEAAKAELVRLGLPIPPWLTQTGD